ncbi:UDP-N-acetylmuramoylalanyl-D-glutamate--2,6-diaminopimelate ligase [Halobacillus dabanensis]|uniref:UDP-N-acetylmuramyl-tripeptide synthetase n=1 Tax=Halobacillus dabanensis TaxID=240302 RepID=A0A1I3W7K8_HALDA|nr:UDP-N-acetylmuramoyl-L-alanyl-D-glutamate--2,6-diaminopimelate ligase [Halobacillus dabanensis]SFK03173.1 UDP-N-acetylmuramoylalanyl-D-glutamate--2,6-diaminopimelate ligase [Halobacillus dabanensis]
MKVKQLMSILNLKQKEENYDLNQKITGVTDDSRKVEEGFVFVAVRGYRVDGHQYIKEAIDRGAKVIVSEDYIHYPDVVCLQAEDGRRALGKIASAFYGHPAEDKIIIGVTGTNGKTTTSHMIKHLCEENGYSCSMFGTIDYVVNGEVIPGIQTTPSAPMLQKLLRESRDDVVVMEVSSHGLEQHRLEGVTFDYCVFTNLYKDHLDYHDTMEDYFAAKSKLFFMMKPGGKAVINTDDSWGQKLADRLSHEQIPHWTVGHSLESDVEIREIFTEPFAASIDDHGEKVNVVSPIEGAHNVYNTLQAYAVGRLLGFSSGSLAESLVSCPGIRGRFETYELENGAKVVIDYAHTADSVEHILDTARQQGARKITHVFGFRGNRDETKRADMIGASSLRSNSYILTLDDLNTSSYEHMIETLENLQREFGNSDGQIIPDRTLAIEKAIMDSDKDEWVIVTGKGHESYQQSFYYPVDSDKHMVEYMKEKFKQEKTDLMA